MRFFIVADIHIGDGNNVGFSMQKKYTEQAPEIMQALNEAAREAEADFIISAGDMITSGSKEDMRAAAALCGMLSVPMYHVLGNHDCLEPDFERLWLKNAPNLFPEGKLETTFVREGLRFDLLTNHWGKDTPCYMPNAGFFTRLEANQFERLRTGDQTLPRVMVFHSQIRPAYPAQTGLNENIHEPCNGFDEVGTALIKEFHPLMIVGGHNHLNVLEKIGPTYALTASALCEAPFEYKVVDWNGCTLSMRTDSLADKVRFPFEYDSAQRYVQGRREDREFRTEKCPGSPQ